MRLHLRSCWLALFASLALACALPTAYAQDTVTPTDAVVRRVNVREAPSTGTTPVLGSLAPGERATLLDDVPGWYRVRLSSGIEGYVSRHWVRIEAAPTPTAGVPFTLHMVDVANGDAIVLDLGDAELLIDGGMHAGPLRDYVAEHDLLRAAARTLRASAAVARRRPCSLRWCSCLSGR